MAKEVTFPVRISRSELLFLIGALKTEEIKLAKAMLEMEQEGTDRDSIDLVRSYRFRGRTIRDKLIRAASTNR